MAPLRQWRLSDPQIILSQSSLYVFKSQGCDFVRNHAIEHIDFCTIHIWPDSWLSAADEEHKLDFTRRWINCHVDCAAELGKPLVITEFGKKPAGPERVAFFEKASYDFVTRPKSVVTNSQPAFSRIEGNGASLASGHHDSAGLLCSIYYQSLAMAEKSSIVHDFLPTHLTT